MPYFDFFNTQEDENKKAPQQGGLNSFFTPKSTNNTIGGAPNVRPQTPAAAPSGVAGDSGSSFVNFERYVNANQGASDANAGQISGQVGGAADKAKTALGSMVDQFNTGVTAGTGHGVSGELAQVFNTAHRTGQPPGTVPPTPATTTGRGGTSQSMMDAPPSSPLKGAIDPKGTENPISQPVATPAPTREDIVKGSQQTYTGPQSLAQQPGYDALTGQVGAAAGDVAALQSKDGLSAWLGKNRNATAGYASDGSGARELDSLLLGRSGGKAFGELGSKYQGLGESVGAANTASIEKARGAEDLTKQAAGEYGGLLKLYDEDEANRKRAEEEKKAAAEKERNSLNLTHGDGKYEEWDDYTGGNRFENTVSNITGALDPVAQVQNATGNRSLKEQGEEQFDQGINKAIGTHLNSSKYNWGLTGHLGTHSDEVKKAIFDSLSGEELKALERMGGTQQDSFIDQRLKKLADEARAALSKLPPNEGGPMGMAAWFQKIQAQFNITPEQLKQLQHLSTVGK